MSSASLAVFVACENPRPLEPKKPKTVVFDAQIWLPGGAQPIIAAFRYYNGDTNFVFTDRAIFFVHANVAQMCKGAHINSSALSEDDYDLIGDVVYCNPTPKANPARLAFASISGTAGNIVSGDSPTFEVHARQFLSALNEGHGLESKGTFPAAFCIPSTGRYQGRNKPIPRDNANVHATGYLTGVQRDDKGSWINLFDINLDGVDFFGQSATPSTAAPAATSSSPVKKGLSFSFDDFNPSDDDTESSKPNKEERAPKRRKVDKEPAYNSNNKEVPAASAQKAQNSGPQN